MLDIFKDGDAGDMAGGDCVLCGVFESVFVFVGLSEFSTLFSVLFVASLEGETAAFGGLLEGCDGDLLSGFSLLFKADFSDNADAVEDDEFVAKPLICSNCPIFMKACNSVCLTLTTP